MQKITRHLTPCKLYSQYIQCYVFLHSFWPSCFLYIMSVLPSVWTMEIDMFHERSKERDLQMADVSSINSSLPNTDSEKV